MKELSVSTVQKKELCVGCGLCECVLNDKISVNLNSAGKYQIESRTDCSREFEDCFAAVCPSLKFDYSDKIWGEYNTAYFGYSNDKKIRYRASSGGMITQTLCFLLKSKRVDAVMQIGADQDDPIRNVPYVSTTAEEVIMRCGSRYAPAKLLSNLHDVLHQYNKIAIVGKPCDIRAVTNYLSLHPEYKNKISYLLSFFCGGVPSQNATAHIMKVLNVERKDIQSFRYRGEGWPGLTTACLKDGTKMTMSYHQAWGRILGRDIHKACKFCADGLGECSDISFGDAWFSTAEGYPDFEERDGRNIILCRSDKGKALLDEMEMLKLVDLEQVTDSENYLKNIQVGQYFRKTSLFGKRLALKLVRKDIPGPPLGKLWRWRGDRNILRQIKVAGGTLKRLWTDRL